MEIRSDWVKDLREKTNAGVMDCKRALEEAKGDLQKALRILKDQGLLQAEKKAQRQASQGLIYSYIHGGGKVGVLLEINCETDFVARNQKFQDLAKDVALQIAGSHPAAQYVSRSEIGENALKAAHAEYNSNLEKYYEQVCLLDQPFIKDSSLTVQRLIQTKIAEIGENIVIKRFVRFELGKDS